MTHYPSTPSPYTIFVLLVGPTGEPSASAPAPYASFLSTFMHFSSFTFLCGCLPSFAFALHAVSAYACKTKGTASPVWAHCIPNCFSWKSCETRHTACALQMSLYTWLSPDSSLAKHTVTCRADICCSVIRNLHQEIA